MLTHLPLVEPRFFLRRWADRVAVKLHMHEKNKTRSKAVQKMYVWLALFACYGTPFLLALSCLTGMMFNTAWAAWGLALAVLCWPLRWASRPWVETPNETTIRTLLPMQYQLIEMFSDPKWLDDIVEWAMVDPYFDTRHLNVVMQLQTEEHLPMRDVVSIPELMKNARHLFGGEVGRRIDCDLQAQTLLATTLPIQTPQGRARRI